MNETLAMREAVVSEAPGVTLMLFGLDVVKWRCTSPSSSGWRKALMLLWGRGVEIGLFAAEISEGGFLATEGHGKGFAASLLPIRCAFRPVAETAIANSLFRRSSFVITKTLSAVPGILLALFFKLLLPLLSFRILVRFLSTCLCFVH